VGINSLLLALYLIYTTWYNYDVLGHSTWDFVIVDWSSKLLWLDKYYSQAHVYIYGGPLVQKLKIEEFHHIHIWSMYIHIWLKGRRRRYHVPVPPTQRLESYWAPKTRNVSEVAINWRVLENTAHLLLGQLDENGYMFGVNHLFLGKYTQNLGTLQCPCTTSRSE